jgi:transcriptional regulator with XRE-family HTH domain
MKEMERKLMLRKLDAEMRPFRIAGRRKGATKGLLRMVRVALNVPMKEIAGRMEVVRSVAFALEKGEMKSSIMLRSLERMAAAMECKVVYGIVPRDGKTLEQLAEVRIWAEVLKDNGQ